VDADKRLKQKEGVQQGDGPHDDSRLRCFEAFSKPFKAIKEQLE